MALDPQIQALLASAQALDPDFAALGPQSGKPATATSVAQRSASGIDPDFQALASTPNAAQATTGDFDRDLRAFHQNATAAQPASTAGLDPQIQALLDSINPAPKFGTPEFAARYGVIATPDPNSMYPVGSELGAMLKNMPAAMGKFYTDRALGARQLWAQLTGGDTQALAQEAAEKRALDVPLAAAPGGTAGELAAAAPLGFIPGANTWLGATAVGAGLGATNPTTANESRTLNTAVGAGLGAGGKLAGNFLGRWLAARQGAPAYGLTPAQQAALQGGETLGMRTTPGASSGSVPLRQLEAKLESQPWTSGPFNALKGGNQAALDRTAAASIGEDAPIVDSTVLGRADERLGSVFESVRNPSRPANVDAARTKQVLNDLEQRYRGLLPNDGSLTDNSLVKQLQSVVESDTPNLEQMGQLASKFGRAAYKQMTSASGDRDLGQALYDVKNHVDDVVQSSLTPSEAAEYASARGQYRTLMTLTKPGVVNPSSGNVSGQALANALARTDKPGFVFGRNQTPLYQAARFAQAFKPIVGDSGTATRSTSVTGSVALGALGGLMEGPHGLALGALPLAGALGSRFYLSGPGSALARGAVALPGAVSRGSAAASRFVAPALPWLGQRAGAAAPLIAAPWMQQAPSANQ